MVGRTPKGDETRQSILRAAAEEFSRAGLDGARMEAIFATAGLSKGAVYFHFASKRELAEAVVEDHKQRWLALAAAEVSRHDQARATVHAIGQLLLHLAQTDSSTWGIVRLAEQLNASASTGQDHTSSSLLSEWVDLLQSIIQNGQASGEFDPSLPAHDLAFVLLSTFDGLKNSSDALGESGRAAFPIRAQLLLSLFEERLDRDR